MPSGVVLRSGDSLLHRAGSVRVERFPTTNLPPDLVAEVDAARREDGWEIPPESWERVARRSLPRELGPILTRVSEAFPQVMGPGSGTGVWACELPVTGALSIGRVWMRHEGRRLSYLLNQAASFEDAPGRAPWVDGQGQTVLLWDDVSQRLLSLGHRRPGLVRYGLEWGQDSLLGRLEARLTNAAPTPVDARSLISFLELHGERREALLAPSGTSLALDVDDCQADQLRFAVGVADLLDTSAGARPSTGRAGGDGMSFAIEARLEGEQGSGETIGLWSGRAAPDQGWIEGRADLSVLRGRRAVLRLLSGPGPAGDANFDHGAWADLRVVASDAEPPIRPHVVLIDVDTLRADRLGCYGYERETSPRIDAWAATRARVYTDSTAVGDWTLPTTLSMLTGLAISQHGVRDVTARLSDAVPTLAELLKQGGYLTLGRSDGGFVVPTFGFARGFDRFRVRRLDMCTRQRLGFGDELRWLADRPPGLPVFLFLQTYMVHTPYVTDRRFDDPSRPYSGRFDRPFIDRRLVETALADGPPPSEEERAWIGAQYDAAVARMDDAVGRFLESLPHVFGSEPYLVVFTSDHGEELLDRGAFGHRHSLHRELLRIPLMIQYPDEMAPKRVERPVSTLDLVPTVLDVAGLAAPGGLAGRSLRGNLEPHMLRVAFHANSAHAVLLDNWKLIAPSRDGSPPMLQPGLYDLRTDPDERQDTAPQHATEVRRLLGLLDDWLQSHGPAAGSDEAQVDQQLLDDLRALGYVGRER